MGVENVWNVEFVTNVLRMCMQYAIASEAAILIQWMRARYCCGKCVQCSCSTHTDTLNESEMLILCVIPPIDSAYHGKL